MPKAIFNEQQKKDVANEFQQNNRKLDTVCYQLLQMVKEYRRVRSQCSINYFAGRYGVIHSTMANYLLDQGVYHKNRHLRIVITQGKECKTLKGLCSVSEDR